MTVKSYEECSWLVRRWRDITLAFEIPRIPGPVKITGLAKRQLNKAINASVASEPSISLDGEEYVLVPKRKRRVERFIRL